MLNIEHYKNSWFFKEINLSKWEILFSEWDLDQNLYIIESWEVFVLKETKDKSDFKILSVLWDEEVFWEASFVSPFDIKMATIKANKDTKLLKIDVLKDLDLFFQKFPNETIDLYKYIISLSNKRLLNANNHILSVYEMNKEIIWLTDLNEKSFFVLIQKFNKLINTDYILYFEKNSIVDGYFTLKYDTRFPWKMLDDVFEIKKEEEIFDLLFLKQDDYVIQKINVLNNYYWFFLLGKGINFTDSELKIIDTISTLLAWVINQKNILKEIKSEEDLGEYEEDIL